MEDLPTAGGKWYVLVTPSSSLHTPRSHCQPSFPLVQFRHCSKPWLRKLNLDKPWSVVRLAKTTLLTMGVSRWKSSLPISQFTPCFEACELQYCCNFPSMHPTFLTLGVCGDPRWDCDTHTGGGGWFPAHSCNAAQFCTWSPCCCHEAPLFCQFLFPSGQFHPSQRANRLLCLLLPWKRKCAFIQNSECVSKNR